MIMQCKELNWLCKLMKKGQKQPSSHYCTELNKMQFFPASIVKGLVFWFLVWLAIVQRTVTFWRSYRIRNKFYKQLEELLNWPLTFSSNSGYYYFLSQSQVWFNPLNTGGKLNVHKTFRRRPKRFLNILCEFNLHLVSRGNGVLVFKRTVFS